MARSLLVWLLLKQDDNVLMGLRKPGRGPLAGQWLLPGALMPDEESAEETVRRYAREEMGLTVTEEEFAETLYFSDSADNLVTSIFELRRTEGSPRFRSSGDFAEMRWITPAELAAGDLPIPEALRAFLAGETEDTAGVGVPDNKAAWDAISREYQSEHRIKTDVAHYGPRMPTEADLRLLGDVRGRRILEIGCGGGQCSIAFAREGAIATGIDQSAAQIEFARKLALQENVTVRFLEGDITTLPAIASGSHDAVFSAFALGYVEDIASCLGEAARVLKQGGLLVFSAEHPVRHLMADDDPLVVVRTYWDGYLEWEWGQGTGTWMRDWCRTIEEWCDLLNGAGFQIERILEPKMLADAHDESWDSTFPLRQGLVIPTTLIIKAVKR